MVRNTGTEVSTPGFELHYSATSVSFQKMAPGAAVQPQHAPGDRFLVALGDAITPQDSFHQPSPIGKVKVPTVTVEVGRKVPTPAPFTQWRARL